LPLWETKIGAHSQAAGNPRPQPLTPLAALTTHTTTHHPSLTLLSTRLELSLNFAHTTYRTAALGAQSLVSLRRVKERFRSMATRPAPPAPGGRGRPSGSSSSTGNHASAPRQKPRIGQYIVERTLGTGSFGKVKRKCGADLCRCRRETSRTHPQGPQPLAWGRLASLTR
jgi:hypothetical protein